MTEQLTSSFSIETKAQMSKALHIHPNDNTAVCTSEVKAGEEIEIIDSDGSRSSIKAECSIPFCNKVALTDIQEGEKVFKYGEVIGKAMTFIPKGMLVNHLNIVSQPRSYAEEYVIEGVEK